MRIAGGMFGLELDLAAKNVASPPFMRDPKKLFLNARCGIKFLVDSLRPHQVWMPSYLCCSMIDAITPNTSMLRFFSVDYDLKAELSDWLDQLLPGDLVIVICYFGFPCEQRIVTEVQKRGAFVLEDASQALLSSHVGKTADFVIYSPRKTIGVPDGGILRFKHEIAFLSSQLSSPPMEWWLKALEAVIMRREFDQYEKDRKWFTLFREIEATYPLGPYHMTEFSEALLMNVFDYTAIAEARRRNYNCYLEYIPELAIYSHLDGDTVPLGFPVRLKRRNEVRQLLFDNAIYPPIHWQIDGCVPPRFTDSHRLSDNIMTLPCDQRLCIEDIERISHLLHSTMRRSGK